MARKKTQQAAPTGLLVIGAFVAGIAISYAIFTVLDHPSAPPTKPPPQQSMPPVSTAPVDSPPPGLTYDQLVQGGHTRMDAKRYQSAVNYYTAALAIDSLDPDIWVDRGACKHAQGDGVAARQDFKRGLQLDPTHTIAHFNMGITYYTELKADSAKSWFSRVLVLSPGSAHAKKAEELIAQIDAGK